MNEVDFGRRSGDYAEHRPGFPASFYDRLARYIDVSGTRALDVGTGPGVVALELAMRGAQVTGVDISENQVAAARRRASELGVADRCDFLIRRAEETGLESDVFDLATAGQCWLWFDQQAAMRELLRVLKPGGLLVVAQYCYQPSHSEVAQLTERLILEYNPTWSLVGNTGVYPEHIDALILGGFQLVEQFCYDHDQPFTRASWQGRVRTCNGVGSGALSEERVRAFDDELAKILAQRFPEEPLYIKHRVWATVVRKAVSTPEHSEK